MSDTDICKCGHPRGNHASSIGPESSGRCGMCDCMFFIPA
jgi:hypothetical protein